MAPVHNLCSQIQNSFRWKLRRVAVPHSATNRAICQILYEEGFVSTLASGDETGPFQRGVEVPITPDNIARRKIWLDLKYRDGQAVLQKMRAVSKPSRRIFASVEELQAIAAARRAGPLLKGQEVGQVTILDTPYGIIELKEALTKEVGGEVLCIAA
ncbi:mitochondrial 37S ribosomal protein MRPS8 [Spizellomyces punctatus DAOM BR117]|uniref:30S ribosomal protein S8 n=1 Tax=Spizellomyces punctatus (strain DAOM BR117) TaxID=645134 RepID=A0A0L0H6D5_SPIPD|nr:mitochondrial 37S ribosomal protein MRPS8 [Spizellomyces punctatus DAOM BR117]KNC96278.1 hypothetical protein SPPG_08430 [Spizellomyces punctatus DAOM BR117]|eukprot:XP_016604318.1 hypothetical protein SPPG_08430 [Spizellomyces punctatus DAOM BR117]